ncbi:hypothetical protein RJT34_31135 [Clitoria ternatea]|uniref:Uncharacterized protein n=1 Tax=Clitoria ternatea TaxID=43366 RepID=A0AAN9I131_CLITE
MYLSSCLAVWSFVVRGQHDILTVAFERPEHPSRVRAGSRGHTIRSAYSPTTSSSSLADMYKMFKSIFNNVKALLMSEYEEKFKKFQQHEWFMYGYSHGPDADITKRCELLVDGVDDPVAIGMVYRIGSPQPLLGGMSRVSVVKAIMPYIVALVPTEEVFYVA